MTRAHVASQVVYVEGNARCNPKYLYQYAVVLKSESTKPEEGALGGWHTLVRPLAVMSGRPSFLHTLASVVLAQNLAQSRCSLPAPTLPALAVQRLLDVDRDGVAEELDPSVYHKRVLLETEVITFTLVPLHRRDPPARFKMQRNALDVVLLPTGDEVV